MGIEVPKPTVLIIEDEARFSRLYKAIMSGTEFEPVIVSTGIEGLAYFEANRGTRLVITDRDLDLPEDKEQGIKGEIVAERIRQITGRADDPYIIMVTGGEFAVNTEPMIRRGVNEVIAKPFSSSILLEVLTKANQRFQSPRV